MTLDLVVKMAVKEAVREVLAEIGGLQFAAAGDRPLTYAEAADFASCSPETIGAWVKAGRLPATGKGKLRRVTRDGVRQALAHLIEPVAKKTAPASRAASIVRSLG